MLCDTRNNMVSSHSLRVRPSCVCARALCLMNFIIIYDIQKLRPKGKTICVFAIIMVIRLEPYANAIWIVIYEDDSSATFKNIPHNLLLYFTWDAYGISCLEYNFRCGYFFWFAFNLRVRGKFMDIAYCCDENERKVATSSLSPTFSLCSGNLITNFYLLVCRVCSLCLASLFLIFFEPISVVGSIASCAKHTLMRSSFRSELFY